MNGAETRIDSRIDNERLPCLGESAIIDEDESGFRSCDGDAAVRATRHLRTLLASIFTSPDRNFVV
jgi:hypothetical protein